MATTKEEMMKRAFIQGMSNAAIRFVDKDIDFKVIKADMQDYLEKKGVEATEEEILAHINYEVDRIHEAMIDFHVEYKMMP